MTHTHDFEPTTYRCTACGLDASKDADQTVTSELLHLFVIHVVALDAEEAWTFWENATGCTREEDGGRR